MKILFLSEYFYPFTHGGGEQSTYQLIKSLIVKKFKVFLLTPNYGSKTKEKWRQIFIYRLPFPFKFKKNKPHALSPIFFNNIFFQLICFYQILKLIKKEGINLIHISGNYFLPAAYLVGKLTKKPVVITVRDYQMLCPYGFCLTKKRGYHYCQHLGIYLQEFKQFLKNYSPNKNILIKGVMFISALRTRLVTLSLRFFLRRVDKIICISQKQEKIYKQNGFFNTVVIYNMFSFPKTSKSKPANYIFYGGRLTPGKGVNLLIPALSPILKKKKNLKLVICGEGILKNKLIKDIADYNLARQVKIYGQVSYAEYLKFLSKAKLTIIPSIWEEPFGRVALESLFCMVPAVVSSRGGLKEIIEDRVTGYVIKPDKKSIQKAVKLAFKNNDLLRKNISKKKFYLKKKFYSVPLREHIKLYHLL